MKSKEDLMLNAIQVYNLICELESDVSMGIKSMPEDIDEKLMQETKDKCLKVVYRR